MKFRASLTDKGNAEISGKVEYEGSYADAKQAILVIVAAVAKPFGMTVSDLIIDLYHTEKSQ